MALLRALKSLAGRLFSPRITAEERLDLALVAFTRPGAEALPALHRLFGEIRRRGDEDDSAPALRLHYVVDRLEGNAEWRQAFAALVGPFIASRRLVSFFSDSGILPGTGFFSEWWRIVGHRLLPQVPDERYLKDCTHLVFDRPRDWRWLNALPPDLLLRLWGLLALDATADRRTWAAIQEQLLDAALLLAHRVSGLGMDSELIRTSLDLENYAPCFLELANEAHRFTESQRAQLLDASLAADTGDQLLVIVDQCRQALQRVRRRALTVGTSLHLTYLLTRCEQSLDRIAELTRMIREAPGTDPAMPLSEASWVAFSHAALVAENRRNSFSYYWDQLSRILALRVAENAAHSGEHYLCATRTEYRAMWRSAMGAGVIIGAMALLKMFAAGLEAPLFVNAVLYSLNYGLGFTVIYMLGFTVATKQPAMTAQTLVSNLSAVKPNRAEDLEQIVDLVAAVTRSQLAAIGGNILIAFPTAIAIGLGLGQLTVTPLISPDKAAHLLADLNPLSWAIPHAALAGVFLYLSGLISGYFDNQAACANLGPRIARLGWLRLVAGQRGAGAVGDYVEAHLGGIMGNFLFGCMLGSAGVIGIILGLPIDIRHIAFAAANLGYAMVGEHFALPWQAVAWAVLGVSAIGLTNLAVSFTLALRTALKARRVEFSGGRALLRAIGHRLRTRPGSFILPPKAQPSDTDPLP